MELLFFLLLVTILSLPVLVVKRRKGNKAAKLPPGPPKLPIIGNLHQVGKFHHRSLWELSQKYGPVMLFQLGRVKTIIISSPKMAEEVMKTHDLDFCSRPISHAQQRLTYNFLNMAFSPYNHNWRQVRKLCTMELFSTQRVLSFRHIRKAEVARLISSLSQVSLSPNNPVPVDLSEKAVSLTYSIICSLAFSKSYESINEGCNFKELFEEAMELLGTVSIADFLPGIGEIVDAFTGLHGRIDKCFQKFDSFFESLLDDHLDPARPRTDVQQDIIDVMLSLSKDETAAFRPTKEQTKAILFDVLLGGIQTSSVTIVWAMTELSRNPRVMKKVQGEIRSLVGTERKPNLGVEETELEKLHYLKMVVKETLRLHPPLPLLLPREAIRHCSIGGYNIEQKTRIFVNAWAIGRDPNTWKNPNDFYPERFEDNEIDFKGLDFELIPFGSGRRSCPGLTMGALNVEFTLANLLYCFDWEMPSGMRREDISFEEGVGLAIPKKLPLYLVPIKYWT